MLKLCNCIKSVNFIEPDYKKAMMIFDESAFSSRPFEIKYHRLEEELSEGCNKIDSLKI